MPGFDAEVRASGRGSHAVVVPKAVVAELGGRRVVARVGEESFEATLGAYGGRTFLGLRKSLLTALGLAAGATVHVELEAAAPVAEPEVPPEPTSCAELEAALRDDAPLAAAWEALADGHREEYGRWISVGDGAADRNGRIARMRHRLVD